jgi:hypothetical protein
MLPGRCCSQARFRVPGHRGDERRRLDDVEAAVLFHQPAGPQALIGSPAQCAPGRFPFSTEDSVTALLEFLQMSLPLMGVREEGRRDACPRARARPWARPAVLARGAGA